MIVLAIRTPVLQPGDDLSAMIRRSSDLLDGDIIVVSSKAVATVEGSVTDIAALAPSESAHAWAQKTGRSPAFMEAVLHETERWHGTVKGHCPGALLTELRPEGMQRGVILAPNAGMDESNTAIGTAVGWPHDPVQSAKRIQQELGGTVSVIISDSCCTFRRWGVTAHALVCCGINPLKSEVGSKDLFGRDLRVTVEAVGDQLATAANYMMGNASQSVPAAIVRDHGVQAADFCGWVDGIEPAEDLFSGLAF